MSAAGSDSRNLITAVVDTPRFTATDAGFPPDTPALLAMNAEISRRFRRVMFPYADRVRMRRSFAGEVTKLVAQVKEQGSDEALLAPMFDGGADAALFGRLGDSRRHEKQEQGDDRSVSSCHDRIVALDRSAVESLELVPGFETTTHHW